ncbi:methyltransferase [Propionibacteriaceae bacterium Y2011]
MNRHDHSSDHDRDHGPAHDQERAHAHDHGHSHDHPGDEAAHFDAAAATWDEPDKVQQAAHLAAAIRDRVPLEPTWVALDFGAGTGLLSVRLAASVAEIDMVDTSTGMLTAAEQRRVEHPNLRAVRRDLTTEPAPREHYDLITASLSLHHVPDVAGVLDRFTELLTPGGWVAIAELAADGTDDFHSHRDDFTGHHGFEPAELVGDLTARGFESVGHVRYATIAREVDGRSKDFAVHLITGRAPLTDA